MPRFPRSAVLCSFSLLGSIAGAQTTATNTTVTSSSNSTPYGIAVTVTAGVAPHSAPAVNGPAFDTTPFSTYFGAPVDPSFTNVQGQLTADLNGDGAPDLLVYETVNSGTSPNPVRVQSFLSNGKGGFNGGTPQELTLPAATSAHAGMGEPFLGPGMTTLSCGVFAGSLLLLWQKRRRASWMIIALLGFTLLPLGCGGNGTSSTSKSNNPPAGTYKFQVIATAGTTQTTTNCTLIVQ
jgi:hypothetical protein